MKGAEPVNGLVFAGFLDAEAPVPGKLPRGSREIAKNLSDGVGRKTAGPLDVLSAMGPVQTPIHILLDPSRRVWIQR